MHCTREVGNMITSIFSRKALDANDCEEVVYFWRKTTSYEDVHSHMNSYRHGNVLTRQPWWVNETDGVSGLSVTEMVFLTVTGKDGEKRRRLAWLKHESVDWMKHLINKFLKRGERIFVLFSDTIPAAKASLKLSKQRRFMGCEGDADCFARSTEAMD